MYGWEVGGKFRGKLDVIHRLLGLCLDLHMSASAEYNIGTMIAKKKREPFKKRLFVDTMADRVWQFCVDLNLARKS